MMYRRLCFFSLGSTIIYSNANSTHPKLIGKHSHHWASSGNSNQRLNPSPFSSFPLRSFAEGKEASSNEKDIFKHTALYAQSPMIEEGMVQVTPHHSIYYSVYGHPQGKPVLFVHGGPGGGTDPCMARYFDPKTYKVVLIDQRGCGRSLPFAELEDNSTPALISDFEAIRVKLNISRWLVFGGSWGSTLGLAYSLTHPERVSELVLRGVFLCRQKELQWLYQGPGANYLFPEDWQAYESAIPEEERDDFIAAYGRRLRGELGEKEMYAAAKAWSVWEGRTSKLVQDPWESINSKFGDDKFSLAFARIENHYFTNKVFFPRDGFLLEKQNIDRIRHIPTVIVQGRYDVVCPPVSAFDLHSVFPEAELIFTLAGHSGFERETIVELVAACDKFRPNIAADEGK